MNDYLDGWKERSEVLVPEVRRKGFADQIIIRKSVEPIRRQAPVPNTDEEATVLVFQGLEPRAYIKRQKTGEEIEVKKTGFVIGKSTEADYVIKDNATVSRKHAKITYTPDGYFLEDMGSSNHVFVDGCRITEPIKLTVDMVFRLSEDEDFEFIVRAGE